uniref:Putative secreted peptide n=1 Tax=Anopheles braziliensis TaxID=58242 RepID=A0A2M3ZWC0_9DIPT
MVPPVAMATSVAAAAAATAPMTGGRSESSGSRHCNPARSVASRRLSDAAERNLLQRYYELHPWHHHRLELYATL